MRILKIVLLFLALLVLTAEVLPRRGGGGTPPASLVAHIATSRTIGIAPLAVLFDGTGTTYGDPLTAFRNLRYEWNFGDSLAAGQTWTYSGQSKNVAFGPVVAHVFETPGSHTVTLTVTDSTGASDTEIVQIAVVNPDIVYFETKTVCVSNDADFTGCDWYNAQQITTSTWEDIQAYISSQVRILLHRGHTWTASTMVTIDNTGPGQIEAFGTGADPIIDGPSPLLRVQNTTDWRFIGLDLDGSVADTVVDYACTTDSNHHILFYNVDFLNGAGGLEMDAALCDVAANGDFHDSLFFVGGEIAPAAAGIGLDVEATRLAVMDVYAHGATGGSNIAAGYSTPGYFAHNKLMTGAAGYPLLHVHSRASSGGDPYEGSYNQNVVISDNRFSAPSTATTVLLGSSGASQLAQRYLFERNYITANSTSTAHVLLATQESVVRNNILDFTGGNLSSGLITGITLGGQPPTNSKFNNNSCFVNSTISGDTNVPCVTVSSGTGSEAWNNLHYAPGAASSVVVDITGAPDTSVHDNIMATATPYSVAAPATDTEFELHDAPNSALDTAVTVPDKLDYLVRLRPVGAASDIGAMEKPAAPPVAPAKLNDLNISATRVPTWYPVTIPDTSLWLELDLTNATHMGTLGCGVATNNATDDDAAPIQCAIDAASPQTILSLPAGTYGFSAGTGVIFSDGTTGVVVRGAGPGVTTVRWSGEGKYGETWLQCVKRSKWGFCGRDNPVTQAWTAGYTRGTTDITVEDGLAFAPGDWIKVKMGNDPSKRQCPTSGGGDIFAYHVKVQEVNGNVLTLDRPLRIDYISGGSQTVTLLQTPEYGNGIENFTSISDTPTVNQRHVMFYRAFDDWVKNVEFVDYFQKVISVYQSGRILITQSSFTHDHDLAAPGDNYAIDIALQSSDNHVHDNWFDDVGMAIDMQTGAQGNIASYNFVKNCTGYSRSIFFHGEYPSENLVEGNTADGTGVGECSMHMDVFWGQQGVYNTFFRNRVFDVIKPPDQSGKPNLAKIGGHLDGPSTECSRNHIVSEWTNMVLNHATQYSSSPFCEDANGSCWPLDNGRSSAPLTTQPNLWMERNIAFDTREVTDVCQGLDNPLGCCDGPGSGICEWGYFIGKGSLYQNPPNIPHITMDCGNGLGPSGCDVTSPGDGGNGDTNRDSTGPPADWATTACSGAACDFAISFVEGWSLLTDIPGMCAETVADAGGADQPFIGADVDTYVPSTYSGYIKSPAQRRYESLPCN